MGVMTSVVLRPVTHQDLDLFEVEFATPDGTGAYQWFGHHSPLDLRRRFAETRLLTPDGGTLTICAEAGDVAGRVEWFKSAWGRPETSWCWTNGAVTPRVRNVVRPVRGRGFPVASARP